MLAIIRRILANAIVAAAEAAFADIDPEDQGTWPPELTEAIDAAVARLTA